MARHLVFVLSILSLALPLQTGRATLVVDWHGDYVSQSIDLQGRDSAIQQLDYDGDLQIDDIVAGRAFSTTVPMNPPAPYGLSLPSAVFYGGAAAAHLDDNEGLGVGHWDSFEVSNQGPNDDLHFQVHQGTHQHDLHLAMFWKKDDFLAPGAGLSAVFDPASSYLLEIHNANASMNDCNGRWLVRQGTQFYLSQTTFTPNSGSHSLGGFSATSDGFWAPFNPSGLILDNSASSYLDMKFTDITAVGFHLEHDAFRDNYDFAVHHFAVNAALVPEPAGAALLLGGLLFVRHSRRRD